MIKEEKKKLEPILALERGLRVLELLSEHSTLSLNELHQLSKINKASLLRLVFTFVQQGYVTKNEESGEYSLSMKTYEVGLRALKHIDKMASISSVLSELNETTGRIAQFSVEDNNTLLCLQSVNQNNNLFSVHTNIGGRSPLYCTSAGKAILSSYTNAEIIKKWDKMAVTTLTEHTITDVQSLLADITLTRQRGYALDLEENEYNICCIGSIVLGQSGKPVGSISLSGPPFKDEEEIASYARELLPAVRKLSTLMGYIGLM